MLYLYNLLSILISIIIIFITLYIKYNWTFLNIKLLTRFRNFIISNVNHKSFWGISLIVFFSIIILLSILNFFFRSFGMLFLMLFLLIVFLYITFVINFCRKIFKSGWIVSLTIFFMAVVIFVYIILGALFVSNVGYLSGVMLSYLPILAIPFAIGFSQYLVNVIKSHKAVFGKNSWDNFLNLYSPIFLNLLSVFSIMATLVSIIISNTNCSHLLIRVVYWSVYIIAPMSLVAIWEISMSQLLDRIRKYGLSVKINRLYNKKR